VQSVPLYLSVLLQELRLKKDRQVAVDYLLRLADLILWPRIRNRYKRITGMIRILFVSYDEALCRWHVRVQLAQLVHCGTHNKSFGLVFQPCIGFLFYRVRSVSQHVTRMIRMQVVLLAHTIKGIWTLF
jgi:hypothetical protein